MNGLNGKIDAGKEALSGQITAVLVVTRVGDIVLLAFAAVLGVRLLRKEKEQRANAIKGRPFGSVA